MKQPQAEGHDTRPMAGMTHAMQHADRSAKCGSLTLDEKLILAKAKEYGAKVAASLK